MLIRLENGVPTGYPVLEENFLYLFPDTSFPKFLTPGDVEPFGYGMYEFSQQPEPARYQKVVETTPLKASDGIWYQQCQAVDKTDQEKLEEDQQKADEVRTLRNYKLADCDWTQLPDAPVDHTAWASYRQALRDVTSQPGFPWNVEWPSQPA